MSHDVELEQLRAGVSCAVLLERHPPPWQLDKRESTRNCLKYRRSAGEILLITHQGRGWWDPGSTAKGDVFSLVQHLEPGLNLGQVRKVLRPFIGLSPSFPEHLRQPRRSAPSVPFGTRWNTRRLPNRGSATWRYLVEERGLPAPIVQAAIAGGVLREGPQGSAWFAHHDHEGQLTGIEMRGPDFRGFSPGGDKSLFRFSPTQGPASRLVVAEAPIDALSVAALEGMRRNSLYVATAGGMGPQTITCLQQLLVELALQAQGTLVAATDADTAGESYASRLADLAAAADVSFERLVPQGLKDWNDVLKQGRAA